MSDDNNRLQDLRKRFQENWEQYAESLSKIDAPDVGDWRKSVSKAPKQFGDRLKKSFPQFSRRKKEKEHDKKEKPPKRPKLPQVLVIGRTGAGKSSLINAVLQQDDAPVGVGEPITRDFGTYQSEAIPFELIDSAGLEGGTEKAADFIKGLKRYIKANRRHLKLIWYVIDAQGSRLTDFELEIIRDVVGKKYPIFFVLTKCDVATETQIVGLMQAIIEANLPNEKMAFEVATHPIFEMSPDSEERFAVDELVKKTLIALEVET